MIQGGYIMKKLIDNIVKMPVECQTVRFPACLASAITKIENKTMADQKHYHDVFDVASGLSLHQINLANDEHMVTDFTGILPVLSKEFGDYVTHTMDYAGYSYVDLDMSSSKNTLFEAIKKSIDEEKPAIILFGENQWCLICGYDGSSEIVYGYDGTYAYWDKNISKPDGYENDMFYSTNWYESLKRCIIIGDKIEQSTSQNDLFTRLYNIMNTMQSKRYFKDSAAYLCDNKNFENFTDEGFNNLGGRIRRFFSLPIDQRAVTCWAFKYLSGQTDKRDEKILLESISNLAGSSHDLSWIGWRMTGHGDVPMDECIKLLHSPVNRRAIADLIYAIDRNDGVIKGELQKYINA